LRARMGVHTLKGIGNFTDAGQTQKGARRHPGLRDDHADQTGFQKSFWGCVGFVRLRFFIDRCLVGLPGCGVVCCRRHDDCRRHIV